jgi:hypothetical protein
MPLISYAIEMRVIATELDAEGRPIGEMATQPVKVFRAKTPDVWAEVDKAVERAEQQRGQA